MTFQVRLYLHHDNDLIQMHLNGIRLSDVFAKSLEAHYKKEEIYFEMPKHLELKPHKGRVYRIKVTLDEAKAPGLVRWVRAFPEQYKCHCIKNIARTYLGSTVIDALNGMTQTGAWTPDDGHKKKAASGKVIRLREWKKKEGDQKDTQWIDQVSATRKKTEEQKRKIEEGRARIRNKPIEEILGARPSDIPDGQEADSLYHTEAGTAMAAEALGQAHMQTHAGDGSPYSPYAGSVPGAGPMDAWRDIVGGIDGTDSNEAGNEMDDFDAALFFEQLRTQ